MLLGDPRDWTARFRALDVRFLERVWAVWARCVAVLPQDPDEDTITINLVDFVLKDAKARRLFHHVEYHYEPFGYTADGLAFSLGEIDMAVLLDRDRERYLAYECKRLNEVRAGVTRSLATPYVLKGIRRFVTEQYAAGLPVGCMLGYVMSGNVETARSKVAAAIYSHETEVGLVGELSGETPISSILRFSSRHRRSSKGVEIEIRHALLPFPATVPKRGTRRANRQGSGSRRQAISVASGEIDTVIAQ